MTDGLLSVNREELLNREKEREEKGESWHCSFSQKGVFIWSQFFSSSTRSKSMSTTRLYFFAYKAKCLPIFLSLSSCLIFSTFPPHPLNQTVTGGRASFHANGSVPSFFLCSLSLPVPCHTERVPRRSLCISCFRVSSDTTWLLDTCIFLAPETLWRARIYLRGCGCRTGASGTHAYKEIEL